MYSTKLVKLLNGMTHSIYKKITSITLLNIGIVHTSSNNSHILHLDFLATMITAVNQQQFLLETILTNLLLTHGKCLHILIVYWYFIFHRLFHFFVTNCVLFWKRHKNYLTNYYNSRYSIYQSSLARTWYLLVLCVYFRSIFDKDIAGKLPSLSCLIRDLYILLDFFCVGSV